MAKFSNRDPKSGRWQKVPTENTPLAKDSHFEVMRELDIKTQPDGYAYHLTPRDQSNADPRYDAPRVEDNLGVGGSPLRARRPEMVSAEDADHTIYGRQGAVSRAAAASGSGDAIPGTNVEADASRRLTGRD